MKLEVTRQDIPKVLAALLDRYTIEDVGVQERPLEDAIAELFVRKEPMTGVRDQESGVKNATRSTRSP